MNRSQFQRGTYRNKGGAFKCEICGRRTRETGEDETALQQCRFCIWEGYAENDLADGVTTEEEYKARMAEIAEKRKAADGKK